MALAEAYAPPAGPGWTPCPTGQWGSRPAPSRCGPRRHRGRRPRARWRASCRCTRSRVALALARPAASPSTLPAYPAELVASLRDAGLRRGGRPRSGDEPPSLAIDDDPCPRRRHARTVLQRMLRMGKVGPGYHTEFDHFYARRRRPRPRARRSRWARRCCGRACSIEKPSVGQRHIYLNVRRLPEIHALIERGETRDPQLAETLDRAGARRDRGAYGSAGTVTVTTGTRARLGHAGRPAASRRGPRSPSAIPATRAMHHQHQRQRRGGSCAGRPPRGRGPAGLGGAHRRASRGRARRWRRRRRG